jgi:DNA polymerase-4
MAQQANPLLRGKPVGILKESGRSCIIAASKEAKKLGIKTGCNVSEAKRIYKNIVLVPADFDMYIYGTKKLHQMLTSISPKVEIYSLDEAFIHLEDCKKLYPNLRSLANELQVRVRETLGNYVTCNVGISWNRFLAKMASETAPKGTIAEIYEGNLDHYLMNTELADVCGIGHALEPKLRSFGINNLYDINLLDDTWLLEHFGKQWARELRKMSKGEEPHHLTLIDHLEHSKGVGRSITGWELVDDERDIKRVLANITAEMCSKARKMGLAGRYISVGLYGSQWYWGKHITLKHYSNHTDEVFNFIWNHLIAQWDKSFRVIKFAVYLGMLQKDVNQQLLPRWQKMDKVYKSMDQVNKKYGQHTLMSATMLGGKIIYEEVNGFLGDKQYQFNFR